MKKGWKIFLIVCASVFCLGMILCITAVGMGAGVSQMQDVFHSNQFFWDWGDDDEVTLKPETSQGALGHSSDHTGNEEHFSGSNSVQRYANIKNLDLDFKAGEVVIEKISGNEIQVNASGIANAMELQCESDEDTLEIDTKDHFLGRNNIDIGTLYIGIPENLEFNEIDISIGAGELSADALKGRNVELKVGAGELAINELSCTNLDGKCGAGQMKLILSEKETGYNYNLKCGIGQIRLNDQSLSGIVGKKTINNGSEKNIDLKCGVGEIDIKNLTD